MIRDIYSDLKKLKYNKIFFKSNKDINNYHNSLFLKLKKNLNYDLISYKNQNVILKTTGTTSGIRNSYYYTKKCYEYIEDYHISRIMFFNNIKNGNILFLVPSGSTGSEKDLEPIGPNKIISLGIKNDVYKIFYRYDYSEEDWNILFDNAKNLNPVFIYARPSEVLLLKNKLKKQKYPIILSCEICHDEIRKIAKSLFSDCIDKMRCWDGGCSFFECSYKTKHINDELCVVNCDNNIVTSTDLFNFSQLFFNYNNGDVGDIDQKQCECGIYGNYFKEFRGKSLECIKTNSGCFVPGVIVVNCVYFLQKKYNIEFNFSLRQYKDGLIDFFIDKNLEEEHLIEIQNFLNNIIGDSKYNFYNKINIKLKEFIPYNKQLLIKSDCI